MAEKYLRRAQGFTIPAVYAIIQLAKVSCALMQQSYTVEMVPPKAAPLLPGTPVAVPSSTTAQSRSAPARFSPFTSTPAEHLPSAPSASAPARTSGHSPPSTPPTCTTHCSLIVGSSLTEDQAAATHGMHHSESLESCPPLSPLLRLCPLHLRAVACPAAADGQPPAAKQGTDAAGQQDGSRALDVSLHCTGHGAARAAAERSAAAAAGHVAACRGGQNSAQEPTLQVAVCTLHIHDSPRSGLGVSVGLPSPPAAAAGAEHD